MLVEERSHDGKEERGTRTKNGTEDSKAWMTKGKDLGSSSQEEVLERNIHFFGDYLGGEENKYILTCRERKL